jgi:hypothetical protein
MKRLNESITFYLQNKTKYSVMITGDWGIGKSYYFKNVLRPIIEEIPSLANGSNKYKVVTVSLFGMKSIDDIQTDIMLSIYSILNNKYVKLVGGLAKGVIKLFAKTNGVNEIYEAASKTKVDKSDWLDLSNLVLCFDDLERMSPNLKIDEFIGYVNNLVENENVKVIIIANESKITDPNFKILKEKVIGNTIEFQPDFFTSYINLIESNFKSFPVYHNFLKTEHDFVIINFKKGSTNLRILELALTFFHQAFSELTTNLPNNNILKEKESEILLMLLKFTLVITTEYQEGRINFKNREKLDETDPYEIMSLAYRTNKLNKEDVSKPYRINFTEKYFENESFNYFKSIYEFITGGSLLIYDNLIAELNNLYHVYDNNISEEHRLYKELIDYDNIWKLSDEENKIKIKQLLAYVDKGVYDLPAYVTVFWCATRFNNPLGFNLQKLENRIIKGMKKASEHFKYTPMLASYLLLDESSSDLKHTKKIKASALEINEKLRLKELDSEYQDLEKLLYESFESFRTKIYDRDQHYRERPFLRIFDPKKFYSFFMDSDNATRWQISNFIQLRYTTDYIIDLKEEKSFVIRLKDQVDKKIKGLSNRGITNFILFDFNKSLILALEKLNA